MTGSLLAPPNVKRSVSDTAVRQIRVPSGESLVKKRYYARKWGDQRAVSSECLPKYGQPNQPLGYDRELNKADHGSEYSRERKSRWWRRDAERDGDFVHDKRGNRQQSPDEPFLMSGALPFEHKKSAPEPEMVYRSGLLADDFFQRKGQCPSPSAVSERAILGLGHCESPDNAKRLAKSQAPREVRRTLGTDGASETPRGCGESVACGTQSPASTLPTELLHMIYRLLSAVDFDAARHACKNWYFSSLNDQLLAEQLKRGGWWEATMPQLFDRAKMPSVNNMGGFLAHECSLAGGWTGHGLEAGANRTRWANPMMESARVDFRPVSVTDTQHSVVCTTSPCGQFFLLARNSTIYTYDILPDRLRLISRTSCEKPVLAMAVNVTSDRFAIAALLEGRIGVYVDLIGSASSPPLASQ